MRRFVRENSLGLAAGLLFAMALLGQMVAGFFEYNVDRQTHGELPVAVDSYLTSGHFTEAVFENWESEFLQMATFVLLTVFLVQKGSPESKPLDGDEPQDEKPNPRRRGVPWPVRRGGIALKLYENSLGLGLIGLFLFSFALHAVGGAAEFNEEQLAHGQSDQVTALGYITTSRFWFESFQNWQSEFMSVGVLVVLSIFLRQKGSPESKPVDAPHRKTSTE